MTQDQRSPLESALDLFVYAPVGLALTAIEELPKFAEKGRAQVQGQISIARVVGQFAVAQGRKQIEKRLGANERPSPPPAASSPAATPRQPVPAGQPAPAASRASTSAPGAARVRQHNGTNGVVAFPSDLTETDGGYEKLSGRPDDEPEARSPAGVAGTAGAPVPRADALAIPGYDSLSASQVVQRLAGLSRDELEAVGAYESAHRARRTILTRVNQLKA